jgi:hypothetical protein
MPSVEIACGGLILIPLAAFDSASYVAMVITRSPSESPRASGVLGSFTDVNAAHRFAVQFEMPKSIQCMSVNCHQLDEAVRLSPRKRRAVVSATHL